MARRAERGRVGPARPRAGRWPVRRPGQPGVPARPSRLLSPL